MSNLLKAMILGLLSAQALFAQDLDILSIRNNCLDRVQAEIDILDGKLDKNIVLNRMLEGLALGTLGGVASSVTLKDKDIHYDPLAGQGLEISSNNDLGMTVPPDHIPPYEDYGIGLKVTEKEIGTRNLGRNVLIGAGVGVVGGVGVGLIDKLIKKNRRKKLKKLIYAFSYIDLSDWSILADDPEMKYLLRKLTKRSTRRNSEDILGELRENIINFGHARCHNPAHEISFKELKKYSKNQ